MATPEQIIETWLGDHRSKIFEMSDAMDVLVDRLQDEYAAQGSPKGQNAAGRKKWINEGIQDSDATGNKRKRQLKMMRFLFELHQDINQLETFASNLD